MLDIVQSFPLLSYCIVSPIYISPICNVENYYSEKIKLGILYFSLFTFTMKLTMQEFLDCNNTHRIISSNQNIINIYQEGSEGLALYYGE